MSARTGGLVVVNHGAGNLPNVVRALAHIGARPRVSADPDRVRMADRVVLPGVGAFGDCMDALREGGLVEALEAVRRAGRPILGICVGLQVLFDESEEFGPVTGLGWLRGRVTRIQAKGSFKVPHMGWSQLEQTGAHPVLSAAGEAPFVYFVHSFHALPDHPAVRAAHVRPGEAPALEITAAVAMDNLLGTQFHPEKSAGAGLQILEAFARWSP